MILNLRSSLFPTHLLLGKPRYKRRDNDHRFRQSSTFVRHWWNLLNFCPTIFEVDISKARNPCGYDDISLFRPWDFHIGNQGGWWNWIRHSTLPGKVKVDYYFTAWYSTFLEADPAAQKIERSTLRIAFSNKAAAMMFKMNYHCPELKAIQIAHS